MTKTAKKQKNQRRPSELNSIHQKVFLSMLLIGIAFVASVGISDFLELFGTYILTVQLTESHLMIGVGLFAYAALGIFTTRSTVSTQKLDDSGQLARWFKNAKWEKTRAAYFWAKCAFKLLGLWIVFLSKKQFVQHASGFALLAFFVIATSLGLLEIISADPQAILGELYFEGFMYLAKVFVLSLGLSGVLFATAYLCPLFFNFCNELQEKLASR